MNAQIWRRVSGVAVLALFSIQLGAADDTPIAVQTTDAAPPAAAISAPVTNPPLAPAAVTTDTETVRTIQLPKLTLPATLDQVVKLSQSGADEGVIRAYVEKAAPPYRITGNEIVQLRDLGISQGVIMALIEHSPSAASTGTTEMIGPQNPSQPPAPVETNVAQAPLSEDVAPFYDTLAPYGGWYDVPGYGWCWQPSAVAANPGWRPYCDNGYWLWSDYGWYWNSYYSWGWAPFHYGRWFCHGNGSWYWCPDRTWGSSWVCWRNSSTHCGWAALPPGSHCNGGNWTHHGKHVGANSDFGIHSSHFNFVEHGRFTDRHVGRQTITGSDAQNAIRNSSVVNNYSLSANNRLVNHGMGRETIAAASQTPIRNVTVQELPRGGSALPDRVNRAGRGEVVFRPNAQISVPRATATSISANHGLRPTALASVTPADPTLSRIAPSRGVISGNVAGRQVFPTTSMGSSSRTSISQPRQNGNSLSAPRTASPSIAQNRVYARPSAPASISRAAAPVAGVQRYSAPSAGRSSAPSGGGQSRGSVSRGSGGGGSSHGSGSVSHGSSGGGGGASLRR